MKKTLIAVALGTFLVIANVATDAQAADVIKNGASCIQANSISVVKVKGVSKTYICHTNPATPSVTTASWTLKTCISYFAAAQSQQDNINQQMPLIALMGEPDKTTYTKQLNASQGQLNKVIATIKANYCRAGL